MNRGRKLF